MSTPIGSDILRGQEITDPTAPCGQARAVPIRLDFTATTSYIVDLNVQQQFNYFDSIRSAFVDNSENANEFVLSIPQLNQEIKIPANSQAFVPVFPTNPVNLELQAAAGITKVVLYNVPMPLHVWSTP